MFGDYVIVMKRTDWEGHSEHYVEEWNDKENAWKQFHHLFNANVDMPEDWREVDVILITPEGTMYQLDNSVAKNVKVI